MLDIRKITINDRNLFSEAIKLLNRTQGRDLFAANYLDERTVSASSQVVGAFMDDRLVGIGVADIIDKFDYYQPFQSNISEELEGSIVGSFSTLCVLETMQGIGIGYQISQQRLNWLKAKNCKFILGVSWASGLTHTSDRLFERMGFKRIAKVDNFYYRSSLERPFICPGCGEPPCKCAAILYKMTL